MISIPQLEMQALVAPGGGVPGAPVVDAVQNSGDVSQYPNISQQAFSGHGFKADKGVPGGGFMVPGTWGPQMAPGTAAGIGGDPLLRHILTPSQRLLHPLHPHVCVLKPSRSATEIP